MKICLNNVTTYLAKFEFLVGIMRHAPQLPGQVPEGDVDHLGLQDEVELVRLFLDAAHHVLGKFHQAVHQALEARGTLESQSTQYASSITGQVRVRLIHEGFHGFVMFS